jgi:ribonuclease HI
MLEAVRTVDTNSVLTIFSTQEYVREAMNKKLPKWEHEGWVGVPHRDVLRCLAAELKARKAPTTFKLAAPGSPERLLCRQATVLAKSAARTPENREWEFMALPGLSLQGNRQRVFYQSIREEKTKKMTPRPSTMKALELVRKAAEDNFGRYVSDTDIWRAVHVKDLLPRTAQFLWKGLHNAHRIGNYWVHIPECEDRAICKECDETEDLTHILVGCKSPGRESIWKAAETLWLEKEDRWPAVSLGTILGCGLAEFRDEKGKLNHGTQQLYRILMSESAYLIWRLRNDRVISRDGEPATEDEVTNKWKYAINTTSGR